MRIPPIHIPPPPQFHIFMVRVTSQTISVYILQPGLTSGKHKSTCIVMANRIRKRGEGCELKNSCGLSKYIQKYGRQSLLFKRVRCKGRLLFVTHFPRFYSSRPPDLNGAKAGKNGERPSPSFMSGKPLG